MSGQFGIKETVDVLKASGDVSVISLRAVKKATAGGKFDPAVFGAAMATELMTNPQAIEDLKAAAENIGDVPKELKDLQMGEIFELVTAAGAIAAKCSAEASA